MPAGGAEGATADATSGKESDAVLAAIFGRALPPNGNFAQNPAPMLATSRVFAPFARVSRLMPVPLSRACFSTAAVEDPKHMVLCNVDSDGFATITLNRPEMFNAFSDVVIARCSEIFEALRKENGEKVGLSLVSCWLRASGARIRAGTRSGLTPMLRCGFLVPVLDFARISAAFSKLVHGNISCRCVCGTMLRGCA